MPALLLLATSACGGTSRTAAATQPSPAAFDPAQSDPKALERVEAMTQKIGSAQAWDAVKQLRWEHKYTRDGVLQHWIAHSWDRWNGRHSMKLAIPETVGTGNVEWNEVRYDLFDRDNPYATSRGETLSAADAAQFAALAYDRFQQDSYQLTMIHKLRDPGVRLSHFGELSDESGVCKPKCDLIQVSFDPAVGSDVWFVAINSETDMPEILQKKVDAGQRIGYVLSDWTEAGGLKFARTYENAGLAGDVFTVENIAIGEPNDELYEKPIDRDAARSQRGGS